jgi:hypothetical protein
LPILHDTRGKKKFPRRWVPHALDTNQKAERVTCSGGILCILLSFRSIGFQTVISEDESCFFLSYSSDSIWASAPDEVPEKLNQK